MDAKVRTYVYNIGTDCRLRHLHRRVKKRIVSFAVQLEVRHPQRGTWYSVLRYDTAHGFAHRDWLHLDGTSEKTPLPIEDYRQALQYAEADLKEHWQVYRDRFLKEVEHEERK